MDPTMREAADRGRDDGRYIRGGSGCWLEGARGLQARRSDGGFLIRGPAAVEVAGVEFVVRVPVTRTYRIMTKMAWTPTMMAWFLAAVLR